MSERRQAQLPEGWESKEFEKCLEKVQRATKIPKKKFLDKGSYPIISQESDFINGYWNGASDVLEIEKPVVIFGDHTKIVKYVDFPFVQGADGVKVLQPIDNIDARFFYYQLQSISLADLGYARHYRLLKQETIVIPPLETQKQIVVVLDKAFAAIDLAKANIEKNLQNAKELFQSKLNQIFTQKGDGWEEKKLGDIALFSQGIQVGLKLQETSNKEGYVRFIRIVDYTQNTTDIRYVKDPGSKYFVTEDDIVMVRYGTPGLIGRGKAGVIANNLFKISIKIENVTNDYLTLYLSQPHIQTFLSTQGSSTMPALNFGQLKTVDVLIPSVHKQNDMVQKMSTLKEYLSQIEALYKRKIDDFDELKKSILQKAFAGELTQGSNDV